ncbi:MAG TPA: hypothetical protein VGJ73_13105, partial [Verrucomicrobiae bacterium]
MKKALLALLFMGLTVMTGHTQTITWTNTAGGNWSVAANWSPNQVPGPTNTAVISAPGTYTVAFDENAAIAGMVLGGSSGAQTFSLGNYTFTLNGMATIESNGQFNLNGGTLAGTNTLVGTINWTGGQIGNSANVTIATNGTLVLAGVNGSDYPLYGILTNAGTIDLDSG